MALPTTSEPPLAQPGSVTTKSCPPNTSATLVMKKPHWQRLLLQVATRPSLPASGILAAKAPTPRTTVLKSTRVGTVQAHLPAASSHPIKIPSFQTAQPASHYLSVWVRKPQPSSRPTRTNPSSPTFHFTPCMLRSRPRPHCGKNTATRHNKTHTRANAFSWIALYRFARCRTARSMPV